MLIFKIEPHSSYSGGVALVAANNVEEAIKLFCSNDYNNYEYDILNCTCNIIVGLEYDTITPKIIINCIYSE